MSWLKKLKKWDDQRSAPPVPPEPQSPENACRDAFKSHWEQINSVINATHSRPSLVHTRETALPQVGSITADHVDTVRNLLEQMIFLLVEEQTSGELLGPILEYAITEDVFQRLFEWWEGSKSFKSEILLNLLKVYEVLISQAQHSLLHHKQLVTPMLKLLSAHSYSMSEELDGHVVLLLNLLCVWMNRDPTLLEVFFNASTSHGPANFVIFSLLIDFIHREGTVGQQARDALLLCMALSAENLSVASYIVQNSNFCPVLATGLSALYSTLPQHMVVRTEDWHCLHRGDWCQVPSLINFMNSFEFCNSVIEVAHPLVGEQLLDFFYNGFLVSVFSPSLHKTSADEVVVTTAYLNLFLRSVTAPTLMRCFLHFLLTHRHESSLIINTLIQRIASNNRLALVSLSLMRTLVDFNCEDLMLQLVFRYLMPCQHLLASQRRAICDVDLHNASAARFLALTPVVCSDADKTQKPDSEMFIPVDGHEEQNKPDDTPGAGPQTPVMDPKGNGGFLSPLASLHDAALSLRSQKSPKEKSAFSEFTVNEDLSVTINMHSAVSSDQPEDVGIRLRTITSPNTMAEFGPDLQSQLALNTSYMDYLEDARFAINQCMEACSEWSAPYNGEVPPPVEADDAVSTSASGSNPSRKSTLDSLAHQPPLVMKAETDTAESAMKALSATFQTLNLTALALNSNPPLPKEPTTVEAENGQDVETKDAKIVPGKDVSLVDSPHESLKDKEPVDGNDNFMVNNGVTVVPLDDLEEVKNDGTLFETMQTEKNKSHSNSISQTSSVDDFFRSLMDIVPKSTREKVENDKHTKTMVPANSDEDIESGIEVSSEGDPQNISPNRILTDKDEIKVAEDDSESQPNEDTMSQVSVNTDDMTDEPVKVSSQPQPGDEEMLGAISDTGLDDTHQHSFVDGSDDDFDDSASITSSSFYEPCEDYVPTEVSVAPAVPLKLQGVPYTGPLIGTLFAKLDQMINNSLYENLLLTGIVTRLACYPHPLLRSFLLNTQMVFHPSVRSLYQVLNSARNKIDAYSSQVSDFSVLVRRAQKYLLARGTIPLSSDARTRNSVQDKPMPVPKIKGRTFGGMFMRKKQKETAKKSNFPRLETLLERRDRSKSSNSASSGSQEGGTQKLRASQFYVKQNDKMRDLEERKIRELRTKNAVYASIVLAEFLKELAAVAQEHAVAFSA